MVLPNDHSSSWEVDMSILLSWPSLKMVVLAGWFHVTANRWRWMANSKGICPRAYPLRARGRPSHLSRTCTLEGRAGSPTTPSSSVNPGRTPQKIVFQLPARVWLLGGLTSRCGDFEKFIGCEGCWFGPLNQESIQIDHRLFFNGVEGCSKGLRAWECSHVLAPLPLKISV